MPCFASLETSGAASGFKLKFFGMKSARVYKTSLIHHIIITFTIIIILNTTTTQQASQFDNINIIGNMSVMWCVKIFYSRVFYWEN